MFQKILFIRWPNISTRPSCVFVKRSAYSPPVAPLSPLLQRFRRDKGGTRRRARVPQRLLINLDVGSDDFSLTEGLETCAGDYSRLA